MNAITAVDIVAREMAGFHHNVHPALTERFSSRRIRAITRWGNISQYASEGPEDDCASMEAINCFSSRSSRSIAPSSILLLNPSIIILSLLLYPYLHLHRVLHEPYAHTPQLSARRESSSLSIRRLIYEALLPFLHTAFLQSTSSGKLASAFPAVIQ